jgi:hypothetical protein
VTIFVVWTFGILQLLKLSVEPSFIDADPDDVRPTRWVLDDPFIRFAASRKHHDNPGIESDVTEEG